MVDGDGVGIAEIYGLEPEVGDNVLVDIKPLAVVVVQRTDSVVTTVEGTGVDGDIIVLVAKQDKVGIGGAGNGLLAANGTAREVDIVGTINLNDIGKDIVVASCVVVGVEIDVLEGDVAGIVYLEHVVAAVGRRMVNHGLGRRVGNSAECDGVGLANAYDRSDVNLLLESLVAQLEDNRAVDTCMVEGVDSSSEGEIITTRAVADNVVATTEAHIDRTDDSVVGCNGIALNMDDSGDGVTARSEMCSQQRYFALVAQRKVVRIASGLSPCSVIDTIAEGIIIDIGVTVVIDSHSQTDRIARRQQHGVERSRPHNSGIGIGNVGHRNLDQSLRA